MYKIAKYHRENKEKLQKSRERYQNLSKVEKERKWQEMVGGRGGGYKNLSKNEKNKLVELEKNIIEWGKMLNYKNIF